MGYERKTEKDFFLSLLPFLIEAPGLKPTVWPEEDRLLMRQAYAKF